MPKSFLTLSLFSFYTIIYCQIGGIAGSKINAINHAAIPVGSAEFEPNYNYTLSNKVWDGNGNEANLFSSPDSVLINTSVSLRMAYAFTKNFEVGAQIGNDFSNWSVRYEVMTKDKFGLGLVAGYNLPFGNVVLDRSKRTPDQVSAFVLGLTTSYEFNPSTSIDFNYQYQGYFQDAEGIPSHDSFFYLDAGHYINGSAILIMGSLSYQYSNILDANATKLTFYPGISTEVKDNYFLVLNGMFDLSGKNSEKTSGFAVAWTIIL